MKRDGRFYVGLVGVAAVIAYLVWTGLTDTVVYYLTPSELVAKVQVDPSFHDVGLKMSGRVVAGSYSRGEGQLDHRFAVEDLENGDIRVDVVYGDLLPDTFSDDVEVVVEGRYRPDGVFEANSVLTKCGSRYEASPEEIAG